MTTIISQFVQLGERKVFLRAAGQGPTLLLLHQSPQNSRALIPWIERLSANYAVFAPDTPGFGYSDPPVSLMNQYQALDKNLLQHAIFDVRYPRFARGDIDQNFFRHARAPKSGPADQCLEAYRTHQR